MIKGKRLATIMATTVLSVLAVAGFSACGDENAESGDASGLTKGDWNSFTQTYTDGTGASVNLSYSLYVPTTYDGSAELPLITYIPDATISTIAATKKAECPSNWKKYDNAFILILASDKLGDDPADATTQGGQIVPIINQLCEDYAINQNKLYLTGQSKGGIYDFALNDAYPTMFAATVYVGCQMGGEVNDAQYNAILANEKFKDQKFIYICSGKDPKAPSGQADVKAVLDREGKTYGVLNGLDYTDISGEDAKVKAVLDQGYTQNFFQFAQVTANGVDGDVQEHMQSFEYCYELGSVYEWLIAQSK